MRINRFSLSLLTLFKKPVPDVFRDEVMNPIGASSTWKWVPYTNAYVTIDGKRMASVGGARGGAAACGSAPMTWRASDCSGRVVAGGATVRLVSPDYVKLATTASKHGPDYGLLWWLNTTGKWTGLPTTAFEAQGQGGNIIMVDPAHDLVVVWRWSAQSQEGFRKVVDSIAAE